jgi:hypothetical protein
MTLTAWKRGISDFALRNEIDYKKNACIAGVFLAKNLVFSPQKVADKERERAVLKPPWKGERT